MQAQCKACGGAHETAACKFNRYVCRVSLAYPVNARMCPNLMEQHFLAAAGAGDDANNCQDSDVSEEVRRRTRWSLSSGTGSNVPSKRSAVSATIAGGDEEAVVRGCAVVDESTTDSSIPVVSGTKQSCSPATVNSNNSSESSNARTPQSQQLQLRPKRTQRPVLRYGFEPD
ncbi:hypothetical protein KGM_211601 [Danaus plexippus plexippus]|uniref:Uncharacterized protein n=1 Tax=Danaus plexippus plexippus TaxID=278856 RepID=A0A212F7D2_DANPL|nr:hypothetical protein KGM_211601 [Danaus plexippus plexippus]